MALLLRTVCSCFNWNFARFWAESADSNFAGDIRLSFCPSYCQFTCLTELGVLFCQRLCCQGQFVFIFHWNFARFWDARADSEFRRRLNIVFLSNLLPVCLFSWCSYLLIFVLNYLLMATLLRTVCSCFHWEFAGFWDESADSGFRRRFQIVFLSLLLLV